MSILLRDLWDPTPKNTLADPDQEDDFGDATSAQLRKLDLGVPEESGEGESRAVSRLRNIDLGEDYEGKVVSRKEIDGWLKPKEVEEAEEEEEEDDKEVKEDENDERQSIDLDNETSLSDKQDGNDIEEVQDFAAYEADDNENEEDEADDNEEDEEDEEKSRRKRSKKIEKENWDKNKEKRDVIPHYSAQTQERQMRKSKAVQKQCKLFDEVSKIRIHLQKPYLTSQKMPRPERYQSFIRHTETSGTDLDHNADKDKNKNKNTESNSLEELASQIEKEAMALCNDLLRIQSKLIAKNKEIQCGINGTIYRPSEEGNDRDDTNEDEEMRVLSDPEEDEILTNNTKARSSGHGRHRDRSKRSGVNGNDNVGSWEDMWTQCNNDWKTMMPYCNKTIDSWDKKMKLMDATAITRKDKKNSSNMSLLERIGGVMANPDLILNKMQTVDKLFRMYGDDGGSSNHADPSSSSSSSSQDSQHRSIKEMDERIEQGLEDSIALKYDQYRTEKEVFNDSQFYKRLLKELVDFGMANSTTGALDSKEKGDLHHKIDEINAQKQKERFDYNQTRKKMKYTVRPDMENFMAPRYTHDIDFPVQQFYSSLFQ
ncbi:hypothetical protein RFI_16627 [Reticulomyxa filosa]|uniref:Uncharacterized protein n=1 Tax=Reticulomyxa filosa TaxID=46433 RepID=X6N3D5_RETFI|nr:hypothetical protein RFI_16627 [Reticulomyxa filosa]|eukprot:ETO20591.1 hypothetical protein RFI_16627 [Reticulomyxa filosa]